MKLVFVIDEQKKKTKKKYYVKFKIVFLILKFYIEVCEK